MTRVLNVAEKPSAAREISAILSGKKAQIREGQSIYNKLFDFKYDILNFKGCDMTFTSVTGHLMQIDVVEQYKPWYSCHPVELFDAPIKKSVPSDKEPLKRTLEQEIKKADILILWLDCDREGENIAFEVLEVCKNATRKQFQVYRAHFSAIIPNEIDKACRNLGKPNENHSIAVDTRMEIDLRIGAAFTRFQTMYLKKFQINNNQDGPPPPPLPSPSTSKKGRFGKAAAGTHGHQQQQPSQQQQPISYGPCQFPTLGFVVERYFRIINFKPENYWSLTVSHQREEPGTTKMMNVEFSWKRKRLFDYPAAFILYDKCMDSPLATVVDVSVKESRYRPVPLTTIELQKAASKKLGISSTQTMTIAEDLYTQGIISYPRTETDSFQQGTDFKGLIGFQTSHPEWGQYARRLLGDEFLYPKSGRNNDNSHPPIHPTAPANSLSGNHKKIYDFITRRFLACCSRESIFGNTTVTIDIENEQFSETGVMVIQLGYIEVYPFDKRKDKLIPTYRVGETFTPKSIDLHQSSTVSPHYLTESELLTAMDTNKIGTDATMAAHIQTIQDRQYVTKNGSNQFVPTDLGVSLVASYELMGFEFSKPNLRAAIEADVDKISLGQKTKQQVLTSTIEKYRELFRLANLNTDCFDRSFKEFYRLSDPQTRGGPGGGGGGDYKVVVPQFSVCGKCNNKMSLKSDQNPQEERRQLSCGTCSLTFALPKIGEVEPLNSGNSPHCCPICNYQVISVRNVEKNTTYTICPKCRNKPPNSSDKAPFHCFQCKFDCTLARGNQVKSSNNNNNSNSNNYGGNKPTTTRSTDSNQRRTFTANNNNSYKPNNSNNW